MKKTLLCLFLALMLVLLCACEGNGGEQYADALRILEEGRYAEAAEAFSELGFFKDAKQLSDYAAAVANGQEKNYKDAVNALKELDLYCIRDSGDMVTYFTACQSAETELKNPADGNDVKKAVTAWVGAAKQLDSIPGTLNSTELAEQCRLKAYDAVTALIGTQNGTADYEITGNAVLCLQMMEGYQDSESLRIENSNAVLNAVDADIDSQDWDSALNGLSYVSGTEGADLLVRFCTASKKQQEIADAMEHPTDEEYCGKGVPSIYDEKCKKINWVSLIELADEFDQLVGVKNSEERAEGCREMLYIAAGEMENVGNYKSAWNMFEVLGDYKDAPQRMEANKEKDGAA